MKVQDLINVKGWNENYKNLILKFTYGTEEFNELQSEFIEWGGLDKERVIVSAPTASGKTILAILNILKRIHDGDNSFIYLVPYNSIRDEKYNELLENFNGLDLIIKKGYNGLRELQRNEANLVVSDFSAFDKYSREHPDFNLASFYIFDEIDVLGSDYFGPSIEGSIARLLRKGFPDLLAISATIPESSNLSEWFDAEFFMSDYKPVQHEEEVKIAQDFHEEICNLFYSDDRTKEKSILVMIYDKRRVMSYAKYVAEILNKLGVTPLNDDDDMILDILGKIPKTITNLKLIECLKFKVAFHHSDLHSSTKLKITEYYNQDKIKIIICTPTLLRGVNLKTRTVILPDPYIYVRELNTRILMPFIDYLQFRGRAGRPPYEDKAFVFILCKDRHSKTQFEEVYLNGEMGPLKSGFIDHKDRIKYPLLDKQILIELFNTSKGVEDIIEILSKYYFSVGVPNLDPIKNRIVQRISLLENSKLIEKNIYNKYTTALLGDEYLRNYENRNISIEGYNKLINLSLKIMTDRINFDDRSHFKILNEVLNILGTRNYISIQKRGANREKIEEEMSNILRRKCGIYPDTIETNHVTLVCLIEHLSHITLEAIDDKFGVDSTRLESVTKNLLETYLDALMRILKTNFDNFDEIYTEEESILGENFMSITCDHIIEFIEYLKHRIHYGVKFELIPIVTLPKIGNFRGISMFNSINNRFKQSSELDWTVLKKIEKELLELGINGWGEILIKELYTNLEGVLSVERRMKKVLKLFNIEYNLK